jgi:legumain
MGSKVMRLAFAVWMAAVAVIQLSCSRNEDVAVAEVTAHRIAVVMPMENRTEWERTVNWALANIDRAQQRLGHRVKIEVEWHDENAADLYDFVAKVAGDPSYEAMIGPFSSVKARRAAELMGENDKTIILPVATSTEFQRIFAGKGYVWNLSQSDMSQCEVLLMQARLSEHSEVTLITSDDDYGRSFSDWFTYQATEIGLNVRDVFIYHNQQELQDAVRKISEYKRMYSTQVVLAPGNAEDMAAFDDMYGRLKGDKPFLQFPSVICSDMANSAGIAGRLVNADYEGLALSADPASGFVDAYVSRFGKEPISGEAHLYDAVSLLAYAFAVRGEESLNQTLVRIVDGRGSVQSSWLPDDMADVFFRLLDGQTPDLAGVTGDWTFDGRNHIAVLNTTYSHWVLRDGRYTTIEYLSTDGSRRTTSTFQAWENRATALQQFSSDQPEPEYGPLEGNWAVVVGASDTWANYRHQADAFAMYQLLKRHGYDDDHIVLITEDNIADDPHNVYPGIVKVRPDGPDVRDGAAVDYKVSQLEVGDLRDILCGNRSERLPHVVSSGRNDNIVLFWCGHGNRNQLAWGSNEVVSGNAVRDIVESMRNAGKYRKMLLVMDACYSGTIGEAIAGIPGVLVITAANAFETSKADMKDPEMGIWLSNGFTRVFQETIDEDPSVSIRNLYYILARHTLGSHATVYNIDAYGNAFTNSISEYLRK